jgi:hypothetical protein
MVRKLEDEIIGITLIEHGHVQKFPVHKIKTFSKLGSMIPKIEKYVQRFKHEKESLSIPMDQHVFPHPQLHE